jgi:chromosomal replication initiator protein
LDHLEYTIPDDVIRFIAENVRSSVRELEGSIIKLLAYASLKHQDISVEVAQEALRDKLRTDINHDNSSPALSIPVIQQAVAREWGVTPEGLRSKTRTKNLTLPRQIAMYLTRELLSTQLIEIGHAFGNRDHSTVIHSIDKTLNSLNSDPVFKSRVNKVRSMLEAMRI